MSLGNFVRQHKKLLTYGALAAGGYVVIWPHIADWITQNQGSIAGPPGAPQPPAFVPVYPGGWPTSPPTSPPVASGYPPPGTTLTYYPDPNTGLAGPGTGGASKASGPGIYAPGDNNPIQAPLGWISTGPGGQGYQGPVPPPPPPPPPPTPDPSIHVVAGFPQPAVTHSIYAEWDPVDPSQQWNPLSPVPAGNRPPPSQWAGHITPGALQ